MLIGLIIADQRGTVKTSFTPRHEKDGIFRPPGRVTFPTRKRRETFFDPAAESAAAYPILEPMLSTVLLKKPLNQLVQRLFLSGLCVVLQQDWHERQRYEKQTDRLWQTVVSKTKVYRNCTDVRLAGSRTEAVRAVLLVTFPTARKSHSARRLKHSPLAPQRKVLHEPKPAGQHMLSGRFWYDFYARS